MFLPSWLLELADLLEPVALHDCIIAFCLKLFGTQTTETCVAV
jgi:hypothetical protein